MARLARNEDATRFWQFQLKAAACPWKVGPSAGRKWPRYSIFVAFIAPP